MQSNKTFCPNCSQVYYLDLRGTDIKTNLPLLLSCGHTICAKCLKNLVKFGELSNCKFCHSNIQIEADLSKMINNDTLPLHEVFPINVQILGELARNNCKNEEAKNQHLNDHSDEYYLNISEILSGKEMKESCMECEKGMTTKMCQQCFINLCDSCFAKTHKNVAVFKNHQMEDIALITSMYCKLHKDKPMRYYCKDCKKNVCSDCCLIGEDKDHDIVSIQEINNAIFNDIKKISPKVKETFRRLTKTAVEVGNLLYKAENTKGLQSEYGKLIYNIEQHYSKLCSIMQRDKKALIDNVFKLIASEKESLYNAKNELGETINKSKQVMDSIKLCHDPNNLKQINLEEVLNDAKAIVEGPWYLTREETKVHMKVNDGVCDLVSDYIHLEGNLRAGYKLCRTAEIDKDVIPPPPPYIVYPPELPRDIRLYKKPEPTPKPKEVPSKPTVRFAECSNGDSRTRSRTPRNVDPTQKDPTQKDPTQKDSTQKYTQKDLTQKNTTEKDPTQKYTQNDPPTQKYTTQKDLTQKNTTEKDHTQKNSTSVPYTSDDPVKPKQRRLKELEVGSEETVKVTHFEDPANFYIQRDSLDGVRKDMLVKLADADNWPKPTVDEVTEGQVYVALKKGATWQRCRVARVDRSQPDAPRYHVLCFDFGNTKVVDVHGLRKLSPELAESPAPLAIHCALANCLPKNGNWTKDDTILAEVIIDNEPVVIRAHEVLPGPQLLCDVTTYDGISLARAMVFHDRATMPNAAMQRPIWTGVNDRVEIAENREDYKVKSVETVHVIHVVSPGKFYVRKVKDQAAYEELNSMLEKEYNFSHTRRVFLPEVGMAVVVRVGSTGWARGIVAEVSAAGSALVQFVDTGETLLAHWTRLHALKPAQAAVKPLATECHLAGVTPIAKKWSAATTQLVAGLRGRALRLQAEGSRGRSLPVALYDTDGDGRDVCISQRLVDQRQALPFGVFSFKRHIAKRGEARASSKATKEDLPLKVEVAMAVSLEVGKEDEYPKTAKSHCVADVKATL